MHGDEFIASGLDADLAWLEAQFKERFECKVQIRGPGRGQQREVRVLNRVIRWSKHGILYEANQRHAEIFVRDLGLESAKAAPTAGTREEQNAASVPATNLEVEVVEESPEFVTKDARAF